jgi:hypothetical protein
LNYAEAHESMVTDELDVPSMLKQVKLEYRGLYDDNKWPAAAHATDNRAVDKNFGRVNKAQTAELKSLVNTLVQSTNNSGKDKSSKWTKVKGKHNNSSNKSSRNNPGRQSSGQSNSRRDGAKAP